MKIQSHPQKQSGLTLVELMVALTIALLLLVGTASLFISNKRIYREQDDLSRMQENARFAMEMMIRDLRMTGYNGCSDSIANVTNHIDGADDDDVLLSFVNAVEGSENAADWKPSDSTDQVDNIVAGTDALTVRYLDPTGIKVNTEMAATSADLEVTGSSGMAAGDTGAVMDCQSSDVFEVTGKTTASGNDRLKHVTGATTGSSPGNADAVFGKLYGTDAELGKVVTRRYFIGTGTSGPALFRVQNYDIFDSTNPLIEGVENMQILYGKDTTGDGVADTFVDAAGVTTWDKVVSVRVALLMQAVKENFENDLDTNTYDLLGTTIDPLDDHRRRRIFAATVQIRNRINKT